MKFAPLALSTLLLTPLPFAPSFAADAPRAAPMLMRMDKNNDGTLTKAEVQDARAQQFERLDLNKDGIIDEHEIELARDKIDDRAAMMETRLSANMKRLDKNSDGQVTAEEFKSDMPLFDLADSNHDGKLTADELKSARANRPRLRQ
jgi:Ca2+-binding EF-hand superfamily protein